MAEHQILRRRPFHSQGRSVPLRLHSENDCQTRSHLLSPIKLKTQASKHLKPGSQHYPSQTSLEEEKMVQETRRLFILQKFDQAIVVSKQLLAVSSSVHTQALYYLGCSFLRKQKYEHCIYYLNLQVQKDPLLNKNSFLLLAIAYKSLNLFKAAIKAVAKGIELFNGFEDASLYMAKLFMKIKDQERAISILEGIIGTNPSSLNTITYADCLRLVGRTLESIQHYNTVTGDNHMMLVALLKRMTAYFQLKQYSKSLADSNILIQNGVETSEVYYFKGMNQLALIGGEEFPVEFSRALDLNNHELAVTRSLCETIKNHIIRKDVYGAEAQLKRIPFLNIREAEIKCLKLFVEGAVDCVKKRAKDAVSKLLQVDRLLKSNVVNGDFLGQHLNPYLGYAYFISSDYEKAIKCYQAGPKHTKATQYNKLLCQGIYLHQSQQYSKCALKLAVAKSILSHYEPYFYTGINLVQQSFTNNGQGLLQKAILELQNGIKFNPPSIYYFYFTLLLILCKRPAEQMINLAIEKSDDNIADYYFVRGIVESNNDLSVALLDFTSALDILKIPAYYKERSKCHYQLQLYQLAIQDLLKVLQRQNDYQARVLLAFNYYANQDYDLALQALQQCSKNQTNEYLVGVRNSIHIKMGNYKLAGTLGQIVFATQMGIKVFDQAVLDRFQAILTEKVPVGEFDIVEMLCLYGVYHFVNTQYQKSLECFHNSLSEIKRQLSKQLTINFETEAKIYQAKYNIALVHLTLKEYTEAKSLLQALVDQTESQETINVLSKLLGFINNQMDLEFPVEFHIHQAKIQIFQNYKLLSEKFPTTKLRLKSIILALKPMLFYPEKIKFNIFPELNPRFIKQFGTWKVESNPEPPWVIRDGNSFKFTSNMDMQGPQIQVTQTAGQARSSIQISQGARSNHIPTKQSLRLSESTQKKLDRIIQTTKSNL